MFLTIHKLLSPLDLILEQNIIKNDEIIKVKTLNLLENINNDIVFIDEFDKSKDTIFDFLLNLNNERICIIELFRSLLGNMASSEQRLKSFLKAKLCERKFEKTLRRFKNLIEFGVEIKDRFDLKYPYKSENIDEPNNFIVQSNRSFISILNKNKSHIILEFDEANERVKIKTIQKDSSNKTSKYNIFELLRELNKFIKKVGYFLEKTAKNIEDYIRQP